MSLPHLNQYKKIIEEAISTLDLNLSGLVVATEVGSSAFLFTPIIAAMAKARKIIAYTNDSSYGKAAEIIDSCKNALTQFGERANIEFMANRRPGIEIAEADIITNSAHLRPLNSSVLAFAKASAVIPLMYERWELRPDDIDLAYCASKGIRVAGTWENQPSVRIFDYVEQLILKICFDAGYEVSRNRIVVWSTDHFGELAESAFTKNGASVSKTTSVDQLYQLAVDSDFIFFCDYLDRRQLIGDAALIDIAKLGDINPAIGLVHLSGKIDSNFAKKNSLSLYPDKDGHAGRMTETLAHLGKRPAIYLNAAGLKVGECLARGVGSDLVQLFD